MSTDYDDLAAKLDDAISAVEAVIAVGHPGLHLKPVLRELRLRRRRVGQRIKHGPGMGPGGA